MNLDKRSLCDALHMSSHPEGGSLGWRKLPSIFQRIFVFPDCHFPVANAMLSQLIRLAN